ncbi:hypothetical protein PAMP_004112 [Pampus punctatissimus]
MRLLICLLFLYGEFTESGHSLHVDDENFPNRDHMKQESFQHQQRLLQPLPGSAFNLKVQVSDVLSRQYLSQAVVEIYINYTRNNSALTGEDGGVLLHVPYQPGLPVTVVASKNGYIYTLLPFKTSRKPNASLQPMVQFPKSLLNVTDSSDISSFKAYLTIPKLPSEEDSFLNTLGIMNSKSGYVSVELSPVAAVSVQLFFRDTELNVSGPIQISLTLPDSCGLQTSDVVPAWLYNRTTGFFGFAILIDFILHHSSFLMVLLGGLLFIVICLLVGLLYYRRSPSSETKEKMTRKDQTTSTCDDEVFEISSADTSRSQDGLNQSFTERGDNRHNAAVSIYNGNVFANPGAVAVKLECAEQDFNAEPNDLKACLTENLFFYNQPVAILHAPAFFHLEEQLEQPEWSKSATLPRAGASISAASEAQSKNSFTQTVPKSPCTNQNQAAESEDQLGVLEDCQASTSNTSRSQYGLPESVSVPGTLHKIRGNRHSMHALAELSKIPSPQAPRAWFVSLEGKPAAEIHYSVSEQQRRRRPVESRETSLDSGVDMSELNQTSGRRAVTLERNATFVKSKPLE